MLEGSVHQHMVCDEKDLGEEEELMRQESMEERARGLG